MLGENRQHIAQYARYIVIAEGEAAAAGYSAHGNRREVYGIGDVAVLQNPQLVGRHDGAILFGLFSARANMRQRNHIFTVEHARLRESHILAQSPALQGSLNRLGIHYRLASKVQ